MRNLLLLCLVACGTDPADDPSRREFIAKASRALHPSAAPMSPDQVDAMLGQSDEQIIQQLYADPATRDAVFSMSLSFLGAPIDELHKDGAWAPDPFMYAPAVASARAFRDGGDPMAPLLTTDAPSPTGISIGVRDDLVYDFFGQGPLTGPQAQRRQYVESMIMNDLAFVRRQFANMSPFDQTAACNLYNMTFTSIAYFEIPDMLGVPATITAGGYPQENDDPQMFTILNACGGFGTITQAQALASLDRVHDLNQQLFARLEPIFAQWDSNPEGAFDPVDYQAIGFSSYADSYYYARTHFYPQFWTMAPNSSTNFDRKRAAYVLERYFCDDLKPVGAALPDNHAQGKHASDPACAACHFKLDPMAGFFRRHGYLGTEFTPGLLSQIGNQITFDDFATADFTQYDQAWKNSDGSYNVGYIRSTRDPSLNSMGDSLVDLDQILQTAPEVNRCFAQRMFEFFNGPDQAVDPGFLDDVATDMASAGKDRLQRGITRILTGNTFKTADRNSTVCYDLAPGADPAHRPPCEVAAILHSACTSCHGGGNPQAGLDLSTWDKQSDGALGFNHVTNGKAVSAHDTFQEMHDRLVTSDVTIQMPQGKDMPIHQREQLVLWLETQLGD